jgi:outer membrane receptor protein involved in Fe transport
MRRASLWLAWLCVLMAIGAPVHAQQTTGTIAGRLVDAQGAAVPGVTVTGRNAQTGFVRTGVTDGEGIYRLTALPVGTYDLTAELQGFTTIENKGIVLNVGQTLDVDMILKLASVQESVTVTGETPLIETSSSSVGGVVDVGRIESLPLNGRQFANLAATIPGVGLGFHSDPTKSSQYSPQINGGNGRNVNYQIDGGDNNDDTVGGLLQLFPLEAIQEFNFVTQRFKAEYGRSNGGVMNIVTKSGTNDYRGSFFTLFRDKSLNARTFSQEIANIEKTDYRRYQFGGSFGGPILMNRTHFFGAIERTQQDTNQAVNTLGLFPGSDGVYPTPYRENLVTLKATMNVNPSHYLAVRYGRNNNSQPYGATLRNAPSAWSVSDNKFNSFNVNHNWVIGGSKLNEIVFQYADFKNNIPLSSGDPWLIFPNGVRSGANPNTPQSTEQTKWQFRDDFSWSVTGLGGLGHDFKVGANWIHEPHLFATFNGGATPQLTLNSNALDSTVRQVIYNGGAASVNIPLDLYAFYVQDDWRLNDRLTLNLGLRYDYVDGVPIEQTANQNFLVMQSAGQDGRFTNFPLLEDFGQSSRNDGDNWQPRAGFAYDLFGNGRDVVRGGWGVYTDFGYTNSNVLFPAIDVAGGHGQVFFVSNPAGIRKADGSFYTAADPISTIASQNEVDPTLAPVFGQVASPRLEQPYTRQTNFGWSHQLDSATALTVDYVRVDGRDINIRFRPNTRIDGGPRRLADLAIRPNTLSFRTAVSKGESTYDGLIIGLRRRMSRGFDLSGSYTLGDARSIIGTANDELDGNNIQDATDPYNAVNVGPSTRTDARHRVSISAVVQAPWGIQVAPFFIYRSGLPTLTFEGVDLNNDGNVNDITARAYRYTGLTDDGTATFRSAAARESRRLPRCSTCSTRRTRRCRSPRSAWAPAGRSRPASCSPWRMPAISSSPSSASVSWASGSRSKLGDRR